MNNPTIQNPKFLQLHFLTSYPAALLNRDDAGFAKRIPFGGVTRTRISSQCLKRHWRTSDGEVSFSNIGELSVRSRYIFQKMVYEPLVNEDKRSEPIAQAVTDLLMKEVLGESKKAVKDKDKKKEEKTETVNFQTNQVVVMGNPEIAYIRSVAKAISSNLSDPKKVEAALNDFLKQEGKKNLEALRKGAGLDACLFGRMVTSDSEARVDAAIHVSHAFTVHAEQAESDYFSVVDDLQKQAADEQLGSGHIGNVELNSGLYYGYVVVDIPLLVSNLQGCERKKWIEADRTLASNVLKSLVHLIATVSPGAKLGSTAPYAYAHLVLAEAGNAQPATFANAFLKPVSEKNDLLVNTYDAVAEYIQDLDSMYGARNERHFAAMKNSDKIKDALGVEKTDLEQLANWAAGKVKGAM
jgi:CRISPR-associated protein Cas7/Cse4/CasC, subtype I-E/ECOLI